MKKSNEQIKYVVTEGGEQLGVTQRSPKIGERYVEANGKIETAVRNFRNTACLVLTELDTPPFVDREVVEKLFAAAKYVGGLDGPYKLIAESVIAGPTIIGGAVLGSAEGIKNELNNAYAAGQATPNPRSQRIEEAARNFLAIVNGTDAKWKSEPEFKALAAELQQEQA